METCIFSTENSMLVLRIKEILDDNDIESYITNLNTQNMLGDSKFFTGIDLLAGEIKIYVNETDKNNALKLIKKLTKYEKNNSTKYENKKYNEMVFYNYMITKSFILSFCSFILSPLIFNIVYLIKIIKYKLWIGIFLIFLSIVNTIIGVVIVINDTKDFIFYNVIAIPVLCLAKFNSLYKKTKSGYCFLLLIPVIIGGIIMLKEIARSIYYRF